MRKISEERLYEIVRRPIITEKTTLLSSENKVVFEVSKNASKAEIRGSVEFLFKVDVIKVNVLNRIGKQKTFKGVKGYRSGMKRALITLKEGQSIDLGAGI